MPSSTSKKQGATAFALCAFVIAFLPAALHASRLSVYSTPTGDCNVSAQAFQPFNWYVVAELFGDAAAGGITGAAFSLSGADPAWFTTMTPNPAANLPLVQPTPCTMTIAFPACTTGSSVILFSFQSLALSVPTPRTIDIGPTCVPIFPQFDCPLVQLCDATFTLLCVGTSSLCINNAPGCACQVAVRDVTWGAVKTLYAR